MISLALHYDMRAPAFGAPAVDLYQTAIDQTAWGDEAGFDFVYVSEHHGSEDGYLPSPIVLASALASRTSRIRIAFYSLLAPLYHPLRLAEDVAVLDLISRGRVDVLLSLGFRTAEFEMLGVSRADRVGLLENTVSVLRQAWTGEPFEYQGRIVRVTPQPCQRPGPPIFIGGTAEPSARRAAAIADGYIPSTPELYVVYESELARLGKPPAPAFRATAAVFLHVSDDVEADWKRVGPHLLHSTNSYAEWWADERSRGSAGNVAARDVPYAATSTVEALRESGQYLVLSPAECLAFIEALPPDSEIKFRPLSGGIPPDLAWQSLRLFEKRVMPELVRRSLWVPAN